MFRGQTGLKSIFLGAPPPITGSKAKDFNFGLLVILEKPEDLPDFDEHPAHVK